MRVMRLRIPRVLRRPLGPHCHQRRQELASCVCRVSFDSRTCSGVRDGNKKPGEIWVRFGGLGICLPVAFECFNKSAPTASARVAPRRRTPTGVHSKFQPGALGPEAASRLTLQQQLSAVTAQPSRQVD